MIAYIVDDEKKSIEILQHKIKRSCPEIVQITTFQDPKLAIEAIQIKQPDILFLDIAMPVISGFDLLKSIEQPSFEIIFVTAFDDFALEAIKHSAIGYLIKPFSQKDLKEAVDRAKHNIKKKNSLHVNESFIKTINSYNTNNHKIMIPTTDGIQVIYPNQIVYLAGEKGYTRIFFDDNHSFLSSYNLGYFEEKLETKHFFKIHRSYIINKNKVEKIFNSGHVVLENKKMLPITKKRKEDLIKAIQLNL